MLLPGNLLNLSVLLVQTKFKSRGQKAGALAGWRMLESAGLTEVVENKAQRGTDKVRTCIILRINAWANYGHLSCLLCTCIAILSAYRS